MKKKITLVVLFLSTILISGYLVFNYPNSLIWDYFSIKFMFNFLGIFLGISITVIVFMFSMVDKMREKIRIKKDNVKETSELEKYDEQLNVINSLFKELEQDTMFVFKSFILLIFVLIIKGIDIPYLSWSLNEPWTKNNIITVTYISIFFLSLVALYDIMRALFSLIESSEYEG